jgi:large conductance mechanosensitive channel
MLKEFKEFALKGNVLDMAVGIIIGAAFSGIVSSLVADIIMPPVGLFLGHDFSNLFIVLKEGAVPGKYASLADAKKAAAVTFNYGMFINATVNFLIVSFSMFVLIKYIRRIWFHEAPAAAPAPTVKDCVYCLTKIPLQATRCPNCTSKLD